MFITLIAKSYPSAQTLADTINELSEHSAIVVSPTTGVWLVRVYSEEQS